MASTEKKRRKALIDWLHEVEQAEVNGKLDRKIYANFSTNKLESIRDDWRILIEHRAFEASPFDTIEEYRVSLKKASHEKFNNSRRTFRRKIDGTRVR